MSLCNNSPFSIESGGRKLVNLPHQVDDLPAALEKVGRGLCRVALARVGQGRCDEGRLTLTQVFRRLAKVQLCDRLDAIDSVASFNRIEVHLHDAFLTPDELNQNGEVCLQAFANPTVPMPQEHVLSGLLGDGTRAAFSFALYRLETGLIDLFKVKAIVLQEQVVLASHYCLWSIVRHLAEWDPLMFQRRKVAANRLLDAS